MASHATGDGGIPPRDAAARWLMRVMSLGGAYGTRNHTVKNLRDHKGKRVLVAVSYTHLTLPTILLV